MTETTVKPGQIYEHCEPYWDRFPKDRPTVRVTECAPRSNRAKVVDAGTGKNPRWLLVSSLHASGTTERGRRRRSGYRLVQEAPDAD